MRIPLLALALTGAMALTGCSKMASLNTFITEDEATIDPALIGVWQDKDGEDTYVVKQAGRAYSITGTDKSSTFKLEARLLETGDVKIIDITAKDPAPGQIPVHMPLRFSLQGATLRIAFLDSDWLRQLAVQQLGAQNAEGRTVSGASGDAVRNFLVKYGGDPRAQGDEQLLFKAQ